MVKSTEPKVTAEAEPKADPQAPLLERMEQRLTELEDRLETKDAENTLLEETIAELRLQFEADGFDEEPKAEIERDPYYSKNPYMLIGEIPPDQAYPEGQVLGWKNEKHREQRRGWRGWNPMSYGDKYTGKDGSLLSTYVVDPPPRLEGSTKMDNWVRRADTVLCRLDKRIFEARQVRRETTSKRNTVVSGSGKTKVLRDGIELVGSGLRDQARPAGGYKRRETPLVGEHHQNLLTPPVSDNSPQEE